MRSASAPDATKDWLLLSGGAAYAGAGALADNDPRDLYATPETIAGTDGSMIGRLAWTVMDENQKARVDLRDDPTSEPDADRAVFAAHAARRFHPGYAADKTGDWRSQIVPPARTAPGGWSFASLETTADKGWITPEPRDTAAPARALRHDFTTDSVSLLTDVANGGLKRDLNLLALMSDADFDGVPGIGGAAGYVGFETAATGARNAWARTGKTHTLAAPGTRANDLVNMTWPIWSDVREWSRFPTTAQAGGQPMMSAAGIRQQSEADYNARNASQNGGPDAGPDRKEQSAWRQPVILRYRQEIALWAQPDAPPSLATYEILPKINIIVQLWNPYNVPMVLDGSTRLNTSMLCAPYRIRLTQGAISRTMLMLYAQYNSNSIGTSFVLEGTLQPGEIRTWSIPRSTLVSNGSNTPALVPGYFPSGGIRYNNSVLMDLSTAVNKTKGFAPDTPVTAQLDLVASYLNYKQVEQLNVNGRVSGAVFDNKAANAKYHNPARIIGSPSVVTASPLALAADPQPFAVYEIRQKAEAAAGKAASSYATSYGDVYNENQRFDFGEPVGCWHRMLLSDGKIESWFAASRESVIWTTSLNDAENENALSVDGESGFGVTGNSASTGLTNAIRWRLPLHPPIGLLSLSDARLGGGARPATPRDGTAADDVDPGLYAVYRAFGNSLINPYVPTDAVACPEKITTPGTWVYNSPTKDDFTDTTPVDMSWVMNAAVSDSWFCSSLGDWNRGLANTLFSVRKNAATLYADFVANRHRLPDARFAPEPLATRDATLLASSGSASADAFKKLASHLLLEGGFNINSTSVRAWRAFLAASHADTPGAASPSGVPVNRNGAITVSPKPPSGATFPTGGIANADLTATPASDNAGRVNGGRILSDAELDALARAMVAEVKKRGPFLSVGEFLNRRLESGELGRMGAVQSAIETAKLNDFLKKTGRTEADPGVAPNADLAAVYKYSGVGRPGWFSQADLLAPAGNALTARGDTFVIRAFASAGDDDSVRAGVELTVRRTYRHIDGTESESVEYADVRKPANRAFGRRFVPVAVKWLSKEEI